MDIKIILASTSPARKRLLEEAGIPFTAQASEYEEIMEQGISPQELAQKLAMGKAQAVASKHSDAIVIAADSFVAINGEYLGKPHTPEKAAEYLNKISGTEHSIFTGYAAINTITGETEKGVEEIKIRINKLGKEEIDRYISTKEPLKKAGGYALQGIGQIYIEKISGNFSAAIGIPTDKIYQILWKWGVKLPKEPNS